MGSPEYAETALTDLQSPRRALWKDVVVSEAEHRPERPWWTSIRAAIATTSSARSRNASLDRCAMIGVGCATLGGGESVGDTAPRVRRVKHAAGLKTRLRVRQGPSGLFAAAVASRARGRAQPHKAMRSGRTIPRSSTRSAGLSETRGGRRRTPPRCKRLAAGCVRSATQPTSFLGDGMGCRQCMALGAAIRSAHHAILSPVRRNQRQTRICPAIGVIPSRAIGSARERRD